MRPSNPKDTETATTNTRRVARIKRRIRRELRGSLGMGCRITRPCGLYASSAVMYRTSTLWLRNSSLVSSLSSSSKIVFIVRFCIRGTRVFDSCFILNGYGCASFVVAKEYDTVKVFELCSSFEISKLRARTATGQFTYITSQFVHKISAP